MADESRRLNHTRAAFALNKTMKSVNIPLEFFISISVLSPIYYILVRLLALHCSYTLCIAAIKDYPLFHGSSEAGTVRSETSFVANYPNSIRAGMAPTGAITHRNDSDNLGLRLNLKLLGYETRQTWIAIRVTRRVQIFDNKATTVDRAAKFKLIQDTHITRLSAKTVFNTQTFSPDTLARKRGPGFTVKEIDRMLMKTPLAESRIAAGVARTWKHRILSATNNAVTVPQLGCWPCLPHEASATNRMVCHEAVNADAKCLRNPSIQPPILHHPSPSAEVGVLSLCL